MSRMETKVLLFGHGRAERKTNGSAVRHDQQPYTRVDGLGCQSATAVVRMSILAA
jgi:hypothetical protein